MVGRAKSIGTYFFLNEEGSAVIVSGNRCRAILIGFLWPQPENIDVKEIWFEEDDVNDC